MDGKRAAPRKGRRVVFLGGYAPVGRDPCVPPPGTHFSAGHAGPALRDGMLNRAKRDVEDAVPYGMTGNETAGRRTPRAFVPLRSTAGRRPLRNDRETGRRGDVGIAPYEIAGVHAGRGGERWGKMFTLAALTLGNYYCIIN